MPPLPATAAQVEEPAPAASSRFLGVQALRGIAALAVVLFHATKRVHNAGAGTALHVGAAGVDVFFPISGFVMVLTTHRAWGRPGTAPGFLLRRLVRVVPLYWLVTTVELVTRLATPALRRDARLDPWHVVASYLFLPARDPAGKLQPLVAVGWTLVFEMWFYLLFAACLALRWRPLTALTAALLGVAALTPFRPAALGAFTALIDPIVLEFVLGMWIGWWTVQGRRLPVRLAAPAIVASVAALAATQALPEPVDLAGRLALWGGPGALILAATVSLEASLRPRLGQAATLLGDASYAIYLVHPLLNAGAAALLPDLHGAGPGVTAGLVGAIFAVCAAAGVATHLWIERPLTARVEAWRRRVQPAVA